jgi:hypothetical protein
VVDFILAAGLLRERHLVERDGLQQPGQFGGISRRARSGDYEKLAEKGSLRAISIASFCVRAWL